MNVTRVLAATAIAVSLSIGASAQQAPKTPTTGAPTHKSTHVGRDICATHPNLPQCS
jgi:hypothetical protein